MIAVSVQMVKYAIPVAVDPCAAEISDATPMLNADK
jgi:hypothetical protein